MTLVMYLLSRKFHPSFGIPGTEVRGTPDEQMREKARGWEWLVFPVSPTGSVLLR